MRFGSSGYTKLPPNASVGSGQPSVWITRSSGRFVSHSSFTPSAKICGFSDDTRCHWHHAWASNPRVPSASAVTLATRSLGAVAPGVGLPSRSRPAAAVRTQARPAGPAPTMSTSSSMRSPAPAAPSWRMSLSRGSGGWYWAGTILSMQLADLFGQLRNDFEQVAHDAVIGNLENRRVFVLVDG